MIIAENEINLHTPATEIQDFEQNLSSLMNELNDKKQEMEDVRFIKYNIAY